MGGWYGWRVEIHDFNGFFKTGYILYNIGWKMCQNINYSGQIKVLRNDLDDNILESFFQCFQRGR